MLGFPQLSTRLLLRDWLWLGSKASWESAALLLVEDTLIGENAACVAEVGGDDT